MRTRFYPQGSTSSTLGIFNYTVQETQGAWMREGTVNTFPWSPCGERLSIIVNADVRLTEYGTPTEAGDASLDLTQETLSLGWKIC